MTLANKALTALWERGNRADLKGRATSCTLPMTDASFPDYLSIQTVAERETFHAEVRAAEAAGAVAIDWDPFAGKHGQMTRIRLVSLAALSRHLGRPTSTSIIEEARASLATLLPELPTLALFLDAWAANKAPRGIRLADWRKVLDAARVVLACRAGGYADVSERRVSAQLFGDSKRIEALITPLDVLTSGEEGARAGSAEEVLGKLGLLKHPSPMLVAGPATMLLRQGSGDVVFAPVLVPYSGFSPRHITGIRSTPAYLLSVENLTIFHEVASGQGGELRGIVIYTGGFPSPTMLRAYRACLDGLPTGTPVYHWGDTDLGGFRIADVMARECDRAGRKLALWAMAEGEYAHERTTLSERDRAEIVSICEARRWEKAATYVRGGGAAIEQEIQPIGLPGTQQTE